MGKIEIDNYIGNHTSPESPLLGELFRVTHTSVINPNMTSGHLLGRFLEMMIRMTGAEKVLEIGTYTGYGTISMASALPKNGTIDTIEINDELHDLAAGFINKAGLKGRVIMHTGDALEIIPELGDLFDMVFIDGDKREYCDYYNALLPKVRKGGFIIADNVLWGGKVIDKTKDPMTMGIQKFNNMVASDDRVGNVLLPVRDGIMIIWKKGN